MTNYVVDSSVALKWYLPEAHSDAAQNLLRPGALLHAPDCLWVEAAAVLARRVRRGLLAAADCAGLLAALQRQGIAVWPTVPLLHQAIALSASLRVSLQDAIYLAVARQSRSVLVTADRKLIAALLGTRESSRIRWVEDL